RSGRRLFSRAGDACRARAAALPRLRVAVHTGAALRPRRGLSRYGRAVGPWHALGRSRIPRRAGLPDLRPGATARAAAVGRAPAGLPAGRARPGARLLGAPPRLAEHGGGPRRRLDPLALGDGTAADALAGGHRRRRRAG